MSDARPPELATLAAGLVRQAGDARMPPWLAKSLHWTAALLLAEAERRGELAEQPPAANDNGSTSP